MSTTCKRLDSKNYPEHRYTNANQYLESILTDFCDHVNPVNSRTRS